MTARPSPPEVRLVTVVEAARLEPGSGRALTRPGHERAAPPPTVPRPVDAPARLDAALARLGP